MKRFRNLFSLNWIAWQNQSRFDIFQITKFLPSPLNENFFIFKIISLIFGNPSAKFFLALHILQTTKFPFTNYDLILNLIRDKLYCLSKYNISFILRGDTIITIHRLTTATTPKAFLNTCRLLFRINRWIRFLKILFQN